MRRKNDLPYLLDPLEPPLDLLEAPLGPAEPSLDLLEPPLDLLEAPLDLLEPPLELGDGTLSWVPHLRASKGVGDGGFPEALGTMEPARNVDDRAG